MGLRALGGCGCARIGSLAHSRGGVALSPDDAGRLVNPRHIDVTPTLVVEVSSSATRRLDLIVKRALYERSGVPVHWYVDLDAERSTCTCYARAGTAHHGASTAAPRSNSVARYGRRVSDVFAG